MQILGSQHERQRLAGRNVTRVEHEEIDLFVLAARWRDVFALLPNEEPVQLEIFAHDRFTDGGHASVVSLTLLYNDAEQAGNNVDVPFSPHPAFGHPLPMRWGEGRVRGAAVWVFL